jgi:hypothetical protein
LFHELHGQETPDSFTRERFADLYRELIAVEADDPD